MYPTSLVLDNFFGFRHLELDLSAIHVAVITGRNGAGKSSLFDAFRWCLFGRYRESGDALIRRGADRAVVSVDFEARDHGWRVVRDKPRGKTGTLHLYQRNDSGEPLDGPWDDVTAHTIAETQAKIADLVGLSYAALMAGPLMVQTDAERGDLMLLDPKARKELVIEEAEVVGYQALHEAAKEKVAEADYTIRSLNDRIARYDDVISKEFFVRPALMAAEAEQAAQMERQSLASDRVKEATGRLAAALARAEGDRALAERERLLRHAMAQAGEDLNRHSVAMRRQRDARTAPAAAIPETNLHTEGLKAAQAQIDQINAARIEHATLTARQNEMRRELDKMPKDGPPDVPCHAEGIYATCPLLTDLVWSQERKDAFRAEWSALNERNVELDAMLALAPAVEADFRRMDAEDRRSREMLAAYAAASDAREAAREAARVAVDELDVTIARVEEDLVRMRADLDGVVADRARTAQARAEAEVAQSDLEVAERAYQSAKAALAAMEPKVLDARMAVALIDDAKEEVAAARIDLDATARDHDTYTVLTAAFHRDGIPSMVIAGLLPLIEARANEVLARMPEDMQLRLFMGKTTKSGTTSDRLDITVIHEGHETPYGMLSGAQQFRVNLALRLGQQRVLAARAGTSIDFLFLDEADRDLDEEGVEALVETIAAIRDDFRLILLISHHEWLIDRIGSRLNVDRVDGTSSTAIL